MHDKTAFENIEVRRPESWEGVALLYKKVIDYLNSTYNYTMWNHGFYPVDETAREAFERGELFAAYCGGELAGSVVLNHLQPPTYAALEYGFCESTPCQVLCIHTLSVAPEYMRRGVARRLVRYADEHARSLGCRAIRLDTTNINEPALGLYRSEGYSERGTIILREHPPEISFWYVFEKLIEPTGGLV